MVVRDLNEELKDDIVGIFLAGSVATGHINVGRPGAFRHPNQHIMRFIAPITTKATSDIDLFVIHKPLTRQRRLFRLPFPDDILSSPTSPELTLPKIAAKSARHGILHAEVEVEIFINPAARMLREIENLEDATVSAWRSGTVLQDDSHGTVAFIRQRACDVHARGKPRGSETWPAYVVDRLRYDLADLLHDAWDAIEAGDAASGSLMLMRGLSATLDALYGSQGWWNTKEKRRLRDLAERARSGDACAARCLPLAKRIARGDLESVERHASLRELVEVALEGFGGVMKEWVTDWEVVEEDGRLRDRNLQ
ncbi:hypothetical protein HK101_002830 [Irineochytrium annulatum]|nr:hypothetical protein HK101_002830 [Irineochytrium annulatum]